MSHSNASHADYIICLYVIDNFAVVVMFSATGVAQMVWDSEAMMVKWKGDRMWKLRNM